MIPLVSVYTLTSPHSIKKTNQSDSAIYYARKSLIRAQEVKSYSNIIKACKLLAELHQSNDAQKAIEYNKITIAAQDTLNNFGKTSAFESISEFDEKEREYDIETAKTAYKNQTRQYALLAGLAFFLLIVFILFRNNLRKQRTNELLEKQKQEIAGFTIQIEGEREKDLVPSLWKNIAVSFRLSGKIDPDKAKKAATLSIEKYCSVAETLRRGGTVITWDIEVN